MSLKALITEKAGRCLGVSELTASLRVRARHGHRGRERSPQFYFESRGLKRTHTGADERERSPAVLFNKVNQSHYHTPRRELMAHTHTLLWSSFQVCGGSSYFRMVFCSFRFLPIFLLAQGG
eukprot:scaffold50045_cov57-Phaeocystis_antarctica.AAC.5